jgi:hypothetical protein
MPKREDPQILTQAKSKVADDDDSLLDDIDELELDQMEI